jgi:3-methyladenine DNA glycosylase AlkC
LFFIFIKHSVSNIIKRIKKQKITPVKRPIADGFDNEDAKVELLLRQQVEHVVEEDAQLPVAVPNQ